MSIVLINDNEWMNEWINQSINQSINRFITGSRSEVSVNLISLSDQRTQLQTNPIKCVVSWWLTGESAERENSSQTEDGTADECAIVESDTSCSSNTRHCTMPMVAGVPKKFTFRQTTCLSTAGREAISTGGMSTYRLRTRIGLCLWIHVLESSSFFLGYHCYIYIKIQVIRMIKSIYCVPALISNAFKLLLWANEKEKMNETVCRVLSFDCKLHCRVSRENDRYSEIWRERGMVKLPHSIYILSYQTARNITPVAGQMFSGARISMV